MKPYLLVGLIAVLTGCGGPGGEAPSAAPSGAGAGTSPLETFDQDRLWVLIMAVRIGPGGDGCARYYRDPDNPRWKTINRGDLSQVCPEVMVNIATYLRHNGVAGVEPVHLQKPDFWDRMQAKYAGIQQCQEQLGGDIFGPPPDPTKPQQRDFPSYAVYQEADEAYRERRAVQVEEHKRAWTACDPYAVAQQTAQGKNPLPPSLEDLGITLPSGIKF